LQGQEWHAGEAGEIDDGLRPSGWKGAAGRDDKPDQASCFGTSSNVLSGEHALDVTFLKTSADAGAPSLEEMHFEPAGVADMVAFCANVHSSFAGRAVLCAP